MNKVKMVRNIKENNKKDSIERELGWNNRFNTAEKSPLHKQYQDMPTVIKPTNLRKVSSKLRIKTETSHIRIKSANKSSNSTQTLTSLSNSNPKLQTQNSTILNKDPAYNKITTLWDALGATTSYRKIFDNVSIQLASVYREGYFSNELAQLQKIYDYIQGLQKDISSRQKIIELLSKFDKYISLNNNNNASSSSNQLPEKVLNDILSTIKDLRIVSVRIVNQFIKIRKNISYEVLCGKFDLERIKDYNKNYMLAMKNDTDFLSQTNLSYYFNFALESDPFLTSLSETVNKTNNSVNDNKIQVPIEDDMVESIKNCQYVLLREMINNESSKYFPSLESCMSTPSLKPNKRIMNTSINEILMTQPKKTGHQSHIKIGNKSPEYSRMNRLNNGSNSKEYIIAGKVRPLKYEDSKLSDKKSIIDNKRVMPSNVDGYMNYIGKNTQGNECIEAEDLMKIDEIINRSIKQKNEIDEKYIKTTPTKEREQMKEIKKIIEDEQKQKEGIVQPQQDKQAINSIIQNKDINNNKKQASIEAKAKEEAQAVTDNQSNVNQAKAIEETKEDNITQLDYDGYTFQFYSGTLSEFSSTYSSYITQINEEQIIAFNINTTSIDQYLTGVFPKILLVQSLDSSKSLQGLITLSYDSSSQSILKLNITSISTINNSNLEHILLSFLKYSNDNLPYDEMHIEFYYGIKEGQFYLNKSIEDILKSKAKFKWVNMENDGKIRKINYKYTNPSMLMSRDSIMKLPLTSTKDLIVNSMKIKSCSLISLERKDFNDSSNGKAIMQGENEVNDFALMCLFCEMISRYDYSIDSPLLNGIKIDKLRKLSKDFILNQIGIGSEIGEFIQTNLNCVYNKINTSMLTEYFVCGSLMKIDNAFENITSTVINGVIYNQLNLKNIEVFSLKKEYTIASNEDNGNSYNNGNGEEEQYRDWNEKFYLIHTTNENCSLLIYEIVPNGSFNDLLTNANEGNHLRIFQAFKNVYYKIDQQPNETRNIIYLPSFSITKDNYLSQPQSFEGMMITNDDNEYRLGKLNQYETFSIGGDNREGLITFDINEEEDIVIKSDFLIAVINHDLLCDLQIPTIAAYIVKKSNWIKA